MPIPSTFARFRPSRGFRATCATTKTLTTYHSTWCHVIASAGARCFDAGSPPHPSAHIPSSNNTLVSGRRQGLVLEAVSKKRSLRATFRSEVLGLKVRSRDCMMLSAPTPPSTITIAVHNSASCQLNPQRRHRAQTPCFPAPFPSFSSL